MRVFRGEFPCRWPIAFVATVVAMLIMITGVSAHTVELLRSVPAANAVLSDAPTEVRAWYNEEIRTKVSTLQVFDASGGQVDRGDGGVDLNDPEHASMVASLPQLADGAYLVSWNVVLTDGDASSGEFNFYIGASGAVAATAAVSASTVKVAGLADSTSRSSSPLLIFGGVGVLVLVAGGIFFMRRRKTSA